MSERPVKLGTPALPDPAHDPRRCRAVIRLSPELLVELLHLPAGTEIVSGVWQDSPVGAPTLTLLVTHPDLPEVGSGDRPLEANPVLRRQDPIVFESWGIAVG